ncbi:MAG: glycosyltransferase [Pseudomonadales bacterium]|nr:glycosyltransferase [Pseudomonadales bacterium]
MAISLDPTELDLSTEIDWPSVTLITPVHNDLEKARKKIDNLVALDYPKDKITIMMISDGSTDGSDEHLRNDHRIQFIGYSQRQGKPTALNTGVKDAESEIIIFTDVRQQVKSDAAKRLVSRLLEPGIGAVSGELVLLDPETNTGAHVSLYWQYEKFIRIAESQVASVAGVTGALYAIRTEDYTPLEPDTLLDDFEVPLEIIRKGARCIMEAGAIIYDYPQEDTASEKVRKIRTLTGNFQSFFRHPWVFSPIENPIWFQFISHKFLRLVVPYFLLLTFLSSLFLSDPFYRFAFWGQIVFYTLAIVANFIPALKQNRIISLANVFTELNWAAVLALKNYLSEEVNVKWDKTS